MPKYDVEIEVEHPAAEPHVALLRQAITVALAHQDQPPGSAVAILLTSDARLQALNKQFLGEDKLTDVLSFPSGGPQPGAEAYLGDIALSVPMAERQALAAGHSLSEELQLLAVHGLLHLLGYDHRDQDEKSRMWAVQATILDDLGVKHIAPS